VTSKISPRWTVHRAPLMALSSLVFHGPSPLLCIAQGDVWFDNPLKTVCLSHQTVSDLVPGKQIDWDRYQHPHSKKICLRLSAQGWADKRAAIIN